jgi:hypothetical protein
MLPNKEVVPTVPFAAAPVRPPSSVSSLPGSCPATPSVGTASRASWRNQELS